MYPKVTLPAFSRTPESTEQMKAEICRCLYGFLPPKPDAAHFSETARDEKFLNGKGIYLKISAELTLDGRRFSFPFHLVLPKNAVKVPGVVLINFRNDVPDEYLPSEQLCDAGVAAASFGYEDVAPDNDDFTAMAGGFLGVDRTEPYAASKIAIWAWAAHIVMDYVQTRPEIDSRNVAVAGHSRLGKTALLAALFDERFRFIFSNDSGCAGAALFRGKAGEQAADIFKTFPFWFCPAFEKYAKGIERLPFDQHVLLSLLAPRPVYVSSAEEDEWADPAAEYQSCLEATKLNAEAGLPGLIGPAEAPAAVTCLHDGAIGYHIRHGIHELSPEDWQYFTAFMKKNLC